MIQDLLRNENEKLKYIKTVNLDDIGADPIKCGLKGSPTIVARTDKVSEIGGSCKVFQGKPVNEMVSELFKNVNLSEFAKK